MSKIKREKHKWKHYCNYYSCFLLNTCELLTQVLIGSVKTGAQHCTFTNLNNKNISFYWLCIVPHAPVKTETAAFDAAVLTLSRFSKAHWITSSRKWEGSKIFMRMARASLHMIMALIRTTWNGWHFGHLSRAFAYSCGGCFNFLVWINHLHLYLEKMTSF